MLTKSAMCVLVKYKTCSYSVIYDLDPLVPKLITEKRTKFTEFFYVVIMFSVIRILKIYYLIFCLVKITKKKIKLKAAPEGRLPSMPTVTHLAVVAPERWA